MPIKKARLKVAGVMPLLMNNPQTVDRFNDFAKRMSVISAKKNKRTDEDYREYRDLEMESKVYFDPKIGVYVPESWVAEAIASTAFKVAKISRAEIRGAMFTLQPKIQLKYDDMNKVKSVTDVVKNDRFRIILNLPQDQKRLAKAFPIFHKWSFETNLEFDDKIIDPDSLARIAVHASNYGGFGDFRPKFGRAIAEVDHE